MTTYGAPVLISGAAARRLLWDTSRRMTPVHMVGEAILVWHVTHLGGVEPLDRGAFRLFDGAASGHEA